MENGWNESKRKRENGREMGGMGVMYGVGIVGYWLGYGGIGEIKMVGSVMEMVGESWGTMGQKI